MSRRRKREPHVDEIPEHTTITVVCTGRERKGDGTRKKHPAVVFGKVHVSDVAEGDPWYELERDMYIVKNMDVDDWDRQLKAAANREVGALPPGPPALPHNTGTFECTRCANNFRVRQSNLDALMRATAAEKRRVFDLGRIE